MPTDEIFAGYAAYAETAEVAATTDSDPDELASVWVTVTLSSHICAGATISITVAASC